MKHSLTNRILVGKIIGLLTGLLVFLLAPLLGATLDLYYGLGLVVFYVLLGTTIAFVGLFDRHPVLEFNLSWWVSGVLTGLMFHIMLVLLSYESISIMIEQMNILGMQSPWWALLDGVILGLIMSFAEGKLAGKGNKLPIQ